MASVAEVAKIEKASDDLAKVGRDWYVEANGAGMVLYARDPIDNEPRRIADLPADLPYPFMNFLMHAADNLAHALDMLARCRRAYREIAGPPQDSTDYARQCGMRCNEPAFQRFLHEVKGQDVSDAVRVASAVRYLLKIDSRTELNTDAGARERWLKLLGEFKMWMKVVV